MNIRKILEEIAAESGSNMKIEILKKHKDNALLERVLYMTYSKRVKFYIKQIPEYSFDPKFDHPSLEDAMNSLEKLSSRYFLESGAVNQLRSSFKEVLLLMASPLAAAY